MKCGLVPRHYVMGTKWAFRNKLDENEIIVRNKLDLQLKNMTKKNE